MKSLTSKQNRDPYEDEMKFYEYNTKKYFAVRPTLNEHLHN